MSEVKSAHAMKIEVLNANRLLAKTLGVEKFSRHDQACRHFMRAFGRAVAQFTIEAGLPPEAAVGLVIEGVQNALQFKDATMEEALGAAPAGDA